MSLEKAKDYIEILKKDSKEVTFKDLDIIMGYCEKEREKLLKGMIGVLKKEKEKLEKNYIKRKITFSNAQMIMNLLNRVIQKTRGLR